MRQTVVREGRGKRDTGGERGQERRKEGLLTGATVNGGGCSDGNFARGRGEGTGWRVNTHLQSLLVKIFHFQRHFPPSLDALPALPARYDELPVQVV